MAIAALLCIGGPDPSVSAPRSGPALERMSVNLFELPVGTQKSPSLAAPLGLLALQFVQSFVGAPDLTLGLGFEAFAIAEHVRDIGYHTPLAILDRVGLSRSVDAIGRAGSHTKRETRGGFVRARRTEEIRSDEKSGAKRASSH